MTNPSVLEQQEQLNKMRQNILYIEELRKNPLLDKYIKQVAGKMYDRAWWDGFNSAIAITILVVVIYVLFGVL